MCKFIGFRFIICFKILTKIKNIIYMISRSLLYHLFQLLLSRPLNVGIESREIEVYYYVWHQIWLWLLYFGEAVNVVNSECKKKSRENLMQDCGMFLGAISSFVSSH